MNKKALSPVVSAIILIAVTVAVSITVAVWLGALGLTFLGIKEEHKAVSIEVPTYLNATHVKWRLGNNYSSNESSGIVKLPCVASAEVLFSYGCRLEVTYYKEAGLDLFEQLDKRTYEYESQE